MSSNFILENEDIKHLFNGCIEQQNFKKSYLSFRDNIKVLLMLEFSIL